MARLVAKYLDKLLKNYENNNVWVCGCVLPVTNFWNLCYFYAVKSSAEMRIDMENNGVNFIWRERKRNALGLPWTFTTYALAEDRLFVKSGLLKTVENEVRLYRVLDLSMSKTLSQKIFRIGTIQVYSGDKTQGDFELKNIRNPEAVKEQISQLVEANREKKRVASREFIDGDDELLD